MVNWACRAISLPWSQVSDRNSSVGSCWIRAARAVVTSVEVRRPGILTSITNRECRSTRVAMQLDEVPNSRQSVQLQYEGRWLPGTLLAAVGTARDRGGALVAYADPAQSVGLVPLAACQPAGDRLRWAG